MKLIKNELLPVYETDKGSKVVDGRQLHEFLDVRKDFSSWMKYRIDQYGFTLGEDFSPILGKTPYGGGRPAIEYTLTLDMAKELCMVENNDQGRKARKYFIGIEKEMQQIQSMSQMEMVAYLANKAVEKEKEDARRDQQIQALQSGVESIKETIIRRDEDWRKSINAMFNKAVMHTEGKDFQALRRDSYKMLEERARCDLDARLRNLRSRLERDGATKTKIDGVTRMDVIEADPRLKEIYTIIVKELSIRHVPLTLVR